jgi:nicotinamide mononucleotide (NMN) deamidase PncC
MTPLELAETNFKNARVAWEKAKKIKADLQAQRQAAITGLAGVDAIIDEARAQFIAARTALKSEIDNL